MALRWAANLSTMYREIPFIERFATSREDGFAAVEFWWPRGEDLGKVVAAVKATGQKVVGLNLDAGDMAAGERGYWSDRTKREAARRALAEAIELCDRVGCGQMNALVGNAVDGAGSDADQLKVSVEGLTEAAGVARRAGKRLLIEALNATENPKYLVKSTASALEVANALGNGTALQFDAYHMGRMGEDIVAAARRHNDLRIGHVQFADHPGRHEPGTGTLPLDAFFRALDTSGYDGYTALEYIPLHPTPRSLDWIRAW
ncbi:MAG: TIM barrel protein [Chloroflexi bacterium]|nr:TIM barrel protein [Chloroflexota bacterium]